MCRLPPMEKCGKWTYLVYVGSMDPAINFYLVNYLEFKMKFFHGSKGEPQVVNHFQCETCNELVTFFRTNLMSTAVEGSPKVS